jgi:hypothetical protein
MAHNDLLLSDLPPLLAVPLNALFSLGSTQRSSPQNSKMASGFDVLPGIYGWVFMYLEPFSEVLPFVVAFGIPGSNWFHHQLIPSQDATVHAIDTRSKIAIWQLANCYLLLALIGGFVLHTVRNALRHNFLAQERMVGAYLTALAIADVSHVTATHYALPEHLQYQPRLWNSMTHGSVTFVIFLFALRLAWFIGLGRSTSKELGLSGDSRKHRRKNSHMIGLFNDE